jgi:hypothetical protein
VCVSVIIEKLINTKQLDLIDSFIEKGNKNNIDIINFLLHKCSNVSENPGQILL